MKSHSIVAKLKKILKIIGIIIAIYLILLASAITLEILITDDIEYTYTLFIVTIILIFKIIGLDYNKT